jgi:hypothetical protein
MEVQNALLGPAGGITITSGGMLNVDPVPDIPVYNTTTLSCPMTMNGAANVSSNAVFSVSAGITCINNNMFTLKDGSQLVLASSQAWFVNNSLFTGGNAICSTGSSIFSNAPSAFISGTSGGTLQMEGTLANSGYLEAVGGSVISISAAAACHDGSSFHGPGSILLTGNDTLDGRVTVNGQNVQFLGSALTLNGTLEIAAGGNFNWVGGTLTGVGTNVTGTILLDDSGTMLINELATMTLRNCVLTNAAYGTLTWSNAGTVFMGYNAQIANSGKFLIAGDGTLAPLPSGPPGYGAAAVYNFYQVQKISGATNSATVISVPFHDSAQVKVLAGNLKFSGGGDIGVLWLVADGATIQMAGGSFNCVASAFSGLNGGTNGTVRLLSGVTLAIPATNSYLLVQNGCVFQHLGTILGTGYIDVIYDGLFLWSGGVISLTNAEAILIGSSSTMQISGGGNPKTIVAGGVYNEGEISWFGDNAGGGVSLSDNVVFQNYGQFNIQCDASFTDTAVAVHPVFTNGILGVLNKFSTTGTSTFGCKFVNLSLIIAESGTIEFSQFTDSRLGGAIPFIQMAGGSIRFDTAPTVSGIIQGFGKITASSGALTLTGNLESQAIVLGTDVFNQGRIVLGDAPGTVTFSGNNYTQTTNGVLDVPIRGTNAAAVDFGQLIVQGYGQVTLSGTLQAEITDGYAPPIGATFPFLTSFQRNGTFNHVILPPGMQLNYTPGGATLVVTGAVPVQIIFPALTNGQFQFGFNTISNRSYTVQYRDSLTAGTWTFLTNFIATGSYWQPSLIPVLGAQRFFRVSNP